MVILLNILRTEFNLCPVSKCFTISSGKRLCGWNFMMVPHIELVWLMEYIDALKCIWYSKPYYNISGEGRTLMFSCWSSRRQTGRFLKFFKQSYSTVQAFITQHTFLMCNCIFHTCLTLLLKTQRIMSTLVSLVSRIDGMALLFMTSQGTSQTDSCVM